MGLTERALRELMRILETGKFPSDDSAASDLYFAVREALENRRILSDRTAERDQLRAEVERLRADTGLGWNHRHAELLDATARAEAAEGRAAGLYRALCDTVRASGGVASDGISDTFLIIGVPAEMAARKKAQEAAESTVAGLRRALEEIGRDCDNPSEAKIFDQEIGKWVMVWVIEADTLRAKLLSALAASPDEHARRIKSEALEEVSKELRTAIDHVMCGCYNDSDIGGLQLALAKIAQLEKDSEECLKCSYANVAGKKVVYQRCADCDAEADRLEATNGL